MNLLKKRDSESGSNKGNGPPPDAFGYHVDVQGKTVAAIQERADKKLNAQEWVVIEGVCDRK